MKLLKTPITTAAVLTTKIIMLAEGKTPFSEDANRVWVHIVELQSEDWGIGGHMDWLREYESALNILGTNLKPK